MDTRLFSCNWQAISGKPLALARNACDRFSSLMKMGADPLETWLEYGMFNKRLGVEDKGI